MEDEARMAGEPGAYLGVLMGGPVVENDVDDLADRHLALDGIEEADELLMAVALHATPNHCAFEHVERGKQGGGAVSLVVVCHGAGPALFHGQAVLVAVKRLDLRLLIDREHDGVRRRVDVEPAGIAQFGDNLGIVRELELVRPVRLQAVGTPDRERQISCVREFRGFNILYGGAPVDRDPPRVA